MVLFSNVDGARYDSVTGPYTLPSNSIQMDVKVPVQPSNFDALQKGALMGASTFIEHDKTHYYQQQYTMEFIPSPGTKFISTDLHGGPFLHSKPAKINASYLPNVHRILPTSSRLCGYQ